MLLEKAIILPVGRTRWASIFAACNVFLRQWALEHVGRLDRSVAKLMLACVVHV